MNISNLNSLWAAAYVNPLSTISNTSPYGRISNTYQTGASFYSKLQSQQANRMKEEIYNRFHVAVGGDNDTFTCYIPSEVLCRMNTDKALKEKVFNMLEKYRGEDFKKSVMGQETSVKKCTLIFDEEGDMTATLQTDTAKQNKIDQSTRLLCNKILMHQAALMPYQMNLYSGYNNLYGLNGINNFSMLQNPLFSSIWSNLF